MIALAQRREANLTKKFAALQGEFDRWIEITQPNEALEKHHTQVLALTGCLRGLRSQTEAAFERAKRDGILTEARNIESLLLGIRRIWEFFRSKLVQRHDPVLREFLQLADELAWACYRPVLDVAGPAFHREPPLVFLNGGLSPYALSRQDAFSAEDVPGEALNGRTYAPILQHLPIPVIGVPWPQASYFPDLPVVAHETGHTVESDFGLTDWVKAAIVAQLPQDGRAQRSGHWQAWSNEVFADLWGCLTLGPAFVGSLMDFLSLGRNVVENEISTESSSYPTAHLRMLLCFRALEDLGFGNESESFEALWQAEYAIGAMQNFEQDIPAIVESILRSPCSIGGIDRILRDVPELRFTGEDWAYAREAVEARTAGRDADSANTAPRLVAAARVLFEGDPRGYTGDAFKERIASIVKPGTRSGEKILDDGAKTALSNSSFAAGRNWFDDFARWAGGH
jgi:hypothetical protein